MRCFTWPADRGLLRNTLADATGYPSSPVLRQANILTAARAILIRTPPLPVHTGTHGKPLVAADRISLIVNVNASEQCSHHVLWSAPLHGGTPTP
jgi:hypothetical protein